ncbi:short chain dehydrogenase [Aureococcus anophagefferens]|nr:short chain dehydrogenase [Aureococcus anophagefferens]
MAASLPPPPPPEAPEQFPAHLAPDDVATAIRVLDACVALDAEAYESSKALRPCAAPWAPSWRGPSAAPSTGAARPTGAPRPRRARRTSAPRTARGSRRSPREEGRGQVRCAARLERLAASADGLPRIADGPCVAEEAPAADGAGGPAWRLASCYGCRARFPANERHAFYGTSFCGACAALNYGKRSQVADLSGKACVVTGARVKIGFRADVGDWRDRLTVVGADFRDLSAVEALSDALYDLLPGGLDVLVNNACQTVRRPPQYYEPLLRRELDLRNALAGGRATKLLTSEAAGHARGASWPVALRDVDRGDPARRSQLCVLPGDERRDDAAFPAAATDANSDLGQQLDLRRTNSWTLKLEHVSTPELAEVFAINALAPFVLNSKLKALLAKPELSFVVNVSAMEGKFYRRKQPTHPHTNMAKAALNMLTKTSAGDYADCGIYMTAVDTGWSPIDEVDAAARILDPSSRP